MNDAYNNGNLDGEETGKKVCYIEVGDAVMNHLTHAFESNVNNDEADPTLTLTSLGPTPTYNPTVFAYVSDMRYEMRIDMVEKNLRIGHTRHLERIEKHLRIWTLPKMLTKRWSRCPKACDWTEQECSKAKASCIGIGK